MNIPDLINGTFELTGGIVCWLNVRRLLKDRKIEGVDWRVSGFFSAWGIWNLFYYPSLSQWASFAGGLLLVIANTTWVVLALRTIEWNQHMAHKAYDPNSRSVGALSSASRCPKRLQRPKMVCSATIIARSIPVSRKFLKVVPGSALSTIF